VELAPKKTEAAMAFLGMGHARMGLVVEPDRIRIVMEPARMGKLMMGI